MNQDMDRQRNSQNNQVVMSSANNLTQSLISDTPEQAQQTKTLPKTPYVAALFGMMASALGTGIFNIPNRVTDIGVGLFLIYVLIGGIYSYLGCLLLQQMITKKGFSSQGQVCEAAYGVWLKKIMQVCLFLFPWGIAICYQVIIAKFLVQILYDVFKLELYQNRDEQIYNSKGNLIRILINIVVIITNFGIIQLKDISKIQKLSSICVMTVIYNSTTIFILLLTGFVHYGTPDIDYEGIFHLDWSIVQWFSFDSRAFSNHSQAMASFLYCYINHQLVFPTCRNMVNPTEKRLNSCFFNSVLYQLIFYIVVGMSGYLLLIPHQDILPIAPMVLASISAWPMTVGKFLMVISLFIAIPLNLYPARTVFKQFFSVQQTTRNHYLISIGLAVSTCTVAISFVKINSYFGLLGGTAGVLMSCAIPSICFWKMMMKDHKQQQNLRNYSMIIFILIVSVLAFIGGVLSVVDPV